MWQLGTFVTCAYLCVLPSTVVRGNAAQELELFKNGVEISGITSHWVINNKQYEIYTYQKEGKTEPSFDDGTIQNLHNCINCEFAEWTRNELLKLNLNLCRYSKNQISTMYIRTFFSNIFLI